MSDIQFEQEVAKLIEDNLDFAGRLASEFYKSKRNSCIEYEEYISAACLGLCEAAHRYNPAGGAQFKTFAYLRIRGAMYDMLREGSSLSRNSFRQLVPSEPELKTDTEPGIRSKSRFPLAISNQPTELSSLIAVLEQLNFKAVETDSKKGIDLVYREGLSPEENLMKKSTANYLKQLIACLEPSQRKLIEGRYYLEKDSETLAIEMGHVSKSWVSRVHTKAIDNLRHLIACENLKIQQKVKNACQV